MRTSTAAAFLVLALASTACGAGDEGGDDTELVGGKGLDVCGLVSDDTIADLQKAAEAKGKPTEDLMTGAETFVECKVISGVELGFAVRAVSGGPTVDALVEGQYGLPAKPLPGVGDKAVIGSNSYDGIRIGANVGDQEVVVDSNFVARDDAQITREQVIALAKEVVANLGDQDPAPILLPKACPQPDDDKIVETVGEVVVARGGTGDDGSVSCHYLGSTRHAQLASVVGDGGFNLMAQADSDPDDRTEVDGAPALFDDDQIVVFGDDDCVLSASAEGLSFSLSGERPKASSRDEAVDLVKYVKKEIGCPS